MSISATSMKADARENLEGILLNLPLVMELAGEDISRKKKWAVGSGQLKTKGSKDMTRLYCLLSFSAHCPLPTAYCPLFLLFSRSRQVWSWIDGFVVDADFVVKVRAG